MGLCNYERRTGETLSQDDLHDKKLATKLLPKDYDFKSQVFPLPIRYLLIPSCFPMDFKCMNNILQVTPAQTRNCLSSTYSRQGLPQRNWHSRAVPSEVGTSDHLQRSLLSSVQQDVATPPPSKKRYRASPATIKEDTPTEDSSSDSHTTDSDDPDTSEPLTEGKTGATPLGASDIPEDLPPLEETLPATFPKHAKSDHKGQ